MFAGSFADAKEFCGRFRPVLPVAYNPANLNVQPIPSNVPPQQEQQIEENENYVENDGSNEDEVNDDGNGSEPNSNGEEKFVLPPVLMNQADDMALNMLAVEFDDSFSNTSNNGATESIGTNAQNEQENAFENRDETNENEAENEAENEHEDGAESAGNNVHTHTQSIEKEGVDGDKSNETVEHEDALVGKNVDENEVSDNDDQQKGNDAQQINANVTTDSDENLTVAENFELMENGQVRITSTFADGMEMIHIRGQTYRVPTFQVKENDTLSGNLPFQENVSKIMQYVWKQILIFQLSYRQARIVRI